MSNKKVVTRMAPSPTGKFHVGGVRTALYNYLYARQHEGTFIIRSEDTDKERSRTEHEDNMLQVFDWLGISYDHFYRQSERLEVYQEQLKKMIDDGFAYEAEASGENPDQPVIRFKNPNTEITFNDTILGTISFQTEELGDFVIARNITSPLYHLTVVIDDGLMQVSHVIRGQEHINNTARQILILEALGFERPQYAHIPLIMSPRGSKLSKRDPEVIPALEYRELGILPEALINFLAFIGWNPGDEREVMTLSDLIKDFDLNKVQKGGGVFNIEKLHWLNKQYLNNLSDTEFLDYLTPFQEKFESLTEYSDETQKKILSFLRERIQTYADLENMFQDDELTYFFTQPDYEFEKVAWKQEGLEQAHIHLRQVRSLLIDYQGDWSEDSIKSYIFPYAEDQGKGSVLWPLRYVLSGRDKSPSPFYLLSVLGRETSLERLSYFLDRT